jgi:hypothetical protein
MICQAAERCTVKDKCPHSVDHPRVERYNNSCSYGCDVNGGIEGAVCVEKLEKEIA